MSSLTSLLLQSVAPALRDGATPDRDAIERALAEGLQAARDAWPGIEVTDETLVPEIARRLRTLDELPALHFSDLYLTIACAHGDREALARFDRHYLGELDPGLRRLGMPAEGIDELKQQLRLALFAPASGRAPEIGDYSGRGALRGWLRVMAARRARRSLQKDRKAGFGGDAALLDALDPREDPAVAFMKAAHREHCAQAIREALATLSTRERTLLRHHLIDGLSVSEMGARYGVHRATAARWVAAARDKLGATARTILMGRFALDLEQADSLIRFVQSRVEVSFDRLLGDDEGQ